MATAHNEMGVNHRTESEAKRGRVYAQALLDELGLGDFDSWVAQQLCVKGDAPASAELSDAGQRALNALFGRLFQKVTAEEKWTNLPATAQGGAVRAIAESVPKVLGMALRDAINAARVHAIKQGRRSRPQPQ